MPHSSASPNAVHDALHDLGIRHLDPPYTPHILWQAIRGRARWSSERHLLDDIPPTTTGKAFNPASRRLAAACAEACRLIELFGRCASPCLTLRAKCGSQAMMDDGVEFRSVPMPLENG